MGKRRAQVKRKTKETDISLSMDLDGKGTAKINTGIGFFDHMLESLTNHGELDLSVQCAGDLKVDTHHSVEDVGICLGTALDQALGSKRGIQRFGYFIVPMDEALARVVIDLSGRPFFRMRGRLPKSQPGGFAPELVEDFFKAVSDWGKLNLHIELVYGRNSHHCIEAIFKAFAKALAMAVSPGRQKTKIPSTKGVL